MTDAPSPRSAPPKQAAAKPAAKLGARPAARQAGKGKPAAKAKRTGSLRPGLLPVTIAVAVLVLGFKIGDFGMALATGKGISLIAPSIAEEKAPQGLPDANVGAAPAVAKPAVTVPANAPLQVAQATPPAPSGAAVEQPPAAAPAPTVQTGDPAPSGAPGQTFSPTELELLQRLQERRSQLETRAGELDLREAMLTAAEQRFDQKIAELQNLKKEIQGLLTQANAEQQTQLESLVKIYETMKPADAAKIFNSLENDVLLNVISRMKEAKVAPVFAAMDEKRAQEVTILLAARKRLPTVPD